MNVHFAVTHGPTFFALPAILFDLDAEDDVRAPGYAGPFDLDLPVPAQHMLLSEPLSIYYELLRPEVS